MKYIKSIFFTCLHNICDKLCRLFRHRSKRCGNHGECFHEQNLSRKVFIYLLQLSSYSRTSLGFPGHGRRR